MSNFENLFFLMRLAYKMVLQKLIKPAWDTPERTREMEMTLQDCADRTGFRPTKQTYIKSTWKLPITNVVKDFIWKIQLQLLKCRKYFTKMGGEWAEKGTCETCAVTETPEHILFGCTLNGGHETWTEAAKLWRRSSEEPWTDTSLAIVSSLGVIPLMRGSQAGAQSANDKRYQILVSYVAWTIWKARCSRKIGGIEWDPQKTASGL